MGEGNVRTKMKLQLLARTIVERKHIEASRNILAVQNIFCNANGTPQFSTYLVELGYREVHYNVVESVDKVLAHRKGGRRGDDKCVVYGRHGEVAVGVGEAPSSR